MFEETYEAVRSSWGPMLLLPWIIRDLWCNRASWILKQGE